MNRQQLIEKIDRVFSKLVRLRHSDANGWTRCVTCGKAMQVIFSDGKWNPSCHAGHFKKRSVMPLRWNFHNVHPQCVSCNTYRGGCESDYAHYIVNTYGLEVFNNLHDEYIAWKAGKKTYSIGELRDALEDFTRQLKELEGE